MKIDILLRLFTYHVVNIKQLHIADIYCNITKFTYHVVNIKPTSCGCVLSSFL